MSFSLETKAELCKDNMQKVCCAVAEAYGILLHSNMFSSKEIRITSSCRHFKERLPKLFRRAFDVELKEEVLNSRGKSTFYIRNPEDIQKIFTCFGYDGEKILAHHINLGVLEEPCCRAAFLRGAFLAGGSISDPNKSYHLELVTAHYNVSRESFSILLECGLSPKELSRSGNYVTYFKNSGAIEDFFTLIGAPLASMNIMSAKVLKSMRNTINRKVNCDSANADKIVAAAEGQLEAIKMIDRKFGLDELPEKLRQVALLRIANPNSSLAELSELSYPKVSKSCISHRLKKILELAES